MEKSEPVKVDDSKPSQKNKINDTPKCGLTPWRMPQPYCSPLETLSRLVNVKTILRIFIYQVYVFVKDASFSCL